MNRRMVSVLAGIGGLSACWAAAAQAQYVTYYAPVRTAYFAPAPAVVPVIPTVATTVAYAPPAYTVASPVVVAAAEPVVPAPVPVVTYYRAPAVAYAPVPRVVTRYRPILGGTVSRVRYSYMPVLIP